MRSILLATVASSLVAMPRAFDNATAKPAAARVEPQLTGVAALSLPTRVNKRGSETKYPFESLDAVGKAFGVKNKSAAQLSSIVSNANRKNTEVIKDEAGNVVYQTKEISGPDGSKVSVPDTSKPKTKPVKKFFAYDVTPEYKAANKEAFAKGGNFEGAITLVFREL